MDMLAENHRKAAEDIESTIAPLQSNHTRLGSFLRDLGEITIANEWEGLDRFRQGGWYGNTPDPHNVQEALAVLEQIRLWATQ
ncbi:MAG: hypothetical protein ABI234_11280 [Ktedonobacteraceae bacterium]